MTPDELDALLHRIPAPAPSPLLRERVLDDLRRRLTQAPRERRTLPRRPVHKAGWGGLVLAVAVSMFATIVWIVLPKRASSGIGSGQSVPFERVEWETSTNRQEVSRVTLSGRRLYVETPDFGVVAIDRITGRTEWSLRIDPNGPLDWPPAVAEGLADVIVRLEKDLREVSLQIDENSRKPEPDAIEALHKRRQLLREQLRIAAQGDNVYLVSRQVLHCVDRPSGALKWTRRLAFVPSGRPIAIRGYLFVPDAAGAIWTLDVENKGEAIRSYPESIVGSPAFFDPYLYFVSRKALLSGLKVTDGTLSWTYQAGSAIAGEPQVHVHRFPRPEGDATKRSAVKLLLLPAGRTLEVLDADGGGLLWKYDCGAPIKGLPVIKEATVYVATEERTLLALDLVPMLADGSKVDPSGRLRWKRPQSERFLVKGRENVYILGTDGQLCTVRETTGEVTGHRSPGQFTHFLTNPLDGFLYAVRPGGSVVCLREGE